jgi:hypothetical protein
MSGVLNRALAGLTRLKRNDGKFTTGPAVEAAKNEFRKGSDTVAMFLLDFCAAGGTGARQGGKLVCLVQGLGAGL